MKKLLAIDPSLSCTGWALFSFSSGQLLGVGKIRSKPASYYLFERISDMQKRVETLLSEIDLKTGDFLICESATTMRDPRAVVILEQIRGMFETLARMRGVTVPGRVNPRSVQYEILGLMGHQLERVVVKDSAVHGVEKLYTDMLKNLGFDTSLKNLKKNQDIVDAILIGHLALNRLLAAEKTNMPFELPFDEHKRLSGVVLKRLQIKEKRKNG